MNLHKSVRLDHLIAMSGPRADEVGPQTLAALADPADAPGRVAGDQGECRHVPRHGLA
jgi:hypothetical protein